MLACGVCGGALEMVLGFLAVLLGGGAFWTFVKLRLHVCMSCLKGIFRCKVKSNHCHCDEECGSERRDQQLQEYVAREVMRTGKTVIIQEKDEDEEGSQPRVS